MKWVEKFPKPAESPPPPEGDCPPMTSDRKEVYMQWHREMRAYNDGVRANRRFIVARAVDALEERHTADPGSLSPVEQISLVLGVSYLQDDLSTNPMSQLFGGFL